MYVLRTTVCLFLLLGVKSLLNDASKQTTLKAPSTATETGETTAEASEKSSTTALMSGTRTATESVTSETRSTTAASPKKTATSSTSRPTPSPTKTATSSTSRPRPSPTKTATSSTSRPTPIKTEDVEHIVSLNDSESSLQELDQPLVPDQELYLQLNPAEGGWGRWSSCSASCGPGSRTRVCQAPVMCVVGSSQNDQCIIQQCRTTVCVGTTLDIVFVLDRSGSIGSSNWQLMLNFVVNVVQRLNVGVNDVHVGVVSYSSTARTDFNLDTHYDKSQMINAISNIPYTAISGTNTGAGIAEMRTKVFGADVDRVGVPNIAVVVTDGQSSVDPIPEANEAKASGIFMFSVGITNSIDENELKGISQDGVEGQSYWRSPDFQITDAIVQRIVTRACETAEQAGGGDNGGWRQWGLWSTCTANCNGGFRFRSRLCSRTSPPCSGTGVAQQPCHIHSCESDQYIREFYPASYNEIVELLNSWWPSRGHHGFVPNQNHKDWMRHWVTQLMNRLNRGLKRKKRQITGWQRREYRQLSKQDRDRLNNAFYAMMSTYVPGTSDTEYHYLVNIYEWFVSPGAQGGPATLPWHRIYLLVFELVLKSHDPAVSLPYWDSSLDSHLPNARDSIIFSRRFLGTPSGKVVNGAFGYIPVNSANCTQTGATLRRGNRTNQELLIDDTKIAKFNSFSTFNELVRVESALVTGAHTFIGGHMAGFNCGPYDIIFFMHRAFVDLLWEDFRNNRQNPQFVESDYPPFPWPTGHAPNEEMRPFVPLRNIDGLQRQWTQLYYSYAPRPVRCISDQECGRNLWCDLTFQGGRCRSKVRDGGNASGFTAGDAAPCECGEVTPRNECEIKNIEQWIRCINI